MLEHGEQNSSYFFKLEKRNLNNKTINKLNINGQISKIFKEIALFSADFYKKLYSLSFDLDSKLHAFLTRAWL